MTKTTAAQQVQQAYHGYPAGQTVTVAGAANPANNGNYNVIAGAPAFGSPWITPQPLQFPNFTYVQPEPEPEETALELFEDLVGLIKQLEGKLNLDPKDKNKHTYLELIMGRIQEDVINDTIQKLKAIDI